jgi:hypothetical protein
MMGFSNFMKPQSPKIKYVYVTTPLPQIYGGQQRVQLCTLLQFLSGQSDQVPSFF